MKKIIYRKLIRDRIPEIIKNSGASCKTRTLNKKEFQAELKKKVVEEAEELSCAKNKKDLIDELSDIQELTDALLVLYNSSRFELRSWQLEKRKKRGGFSKKLFLEYTKD